MTLRVVTDIDIGVPSVIAKYFGAMLQIITTLFFCIPSATYAFEHKRVALVIGNSAYRYTQELPNPKSDAEAMTTALEHTGFAVTAGINLDRKSFEQAIITFTKALQATDVGLFFYAGHGVQVAGENYLVPVDAKLRNEADLNVSMIKLNNILVQMGHSSKINLIFLDACRDNPLTRGLSRGIAHPHSAKIGFGLAPQHPGIGTMITFSTEPGHVAMDGIGPNSPFTTALLRHMEAPDLDIDQLLRLVRRDVIAMTGGKQVPWNHSSLTEGFQFKPRKPGETAPQGTLESHAGAFSAVIVNSAAKLRPGDVFNDCNSVGWCPTMIVLPAGDYLSGEAQGQLARHLKVDRAFAVGVHEVSWDEWESCVADGGCGNFLPGDHGLGRKSHPVINVSWDDSKSYIYWLNCRLERERNRTKLEACLRNTGAAIGPYRLLWEYEWEYAAKAGTTSKFPWGDEVGQAHANCYNCGSQWDRNQTAPVNAFEPNRWKLYNMLGNVSEWVEDCYADQVVVPKKNSQVLLTSEPNITCPSMHRVHRGGAYNDLEMDIRPFRRFRLLPTSRREFIGLRVARDIN